MSSTPSLLISYVVSSQNAKEITMNAALTTLDAAINGLLAVPMADANVTMTQAQMASAFVFNCTGADTADRNLIVPAVKRFFAVINATTGSHGIVVKTPSGTGVTVSTSMGATLLFCDGVNVISLGASGGGGGGGGTWATEVPSGTVNGTNTAFTLSHAPNPAASHQHYLNGILQDPSSDYTLSSATITYAVAPPVPPAGGSTKLLSTYQY